MPKQPNYGQLIPRIPQSAAISRIAESDVDTDILQARIPAGFGFDYTDNIELHFYDSQNTLVNTTIIPVSSGIVSARSISLPDGSIEEKIVIDMARAQTELGLFLSPGSYIVAINLFSDEIFVFTPTGDIKTLPVGSTALDFAFEIHTDIGSRCIGAKINHKLVPISHKLNSGDQVEILTALKQHPKDDWLGMAVTAKAKSKIKTSLKEEKRKLADEGKDVFEKRLKSLKADKNNFSVNELLIFYKVPSLVDFYYRIAIEAIDLKNLRDFFEQKEQGILKLPAKTDQQTFEEMVKSIRGKSDMLVVGEGVDKIDYKLSPCCNPIPGDDVFGFITINDGIKIHRTNCPNAIQLMSNYAYRIVKARWFGQQQIAFLVGVKMTGLDEVGVVNNITKVISSELKVNIRSLNIESNDGIFEGTIMLFVHDTEHLKILMKKLAKLQGILSVTRIDSTT